MQSGMLVAPRVPNFAERTDMEKLAGTYGKTFHFWQVDRGDELPLGERHPSPAAPEPCLEAPHTQHFTRISLVHFLIIWDWQHKAPPGHMHPLQACLSS